MRCGYLCKRSCLISTQLLRFDKLSNHVAFDMVAEFIEVRTQSHTLRLLLCVPLRIGSLVLNLIALHLYTSEIPCRFFVKCLFWDNFIWKEGKGKKTNKKQENTTNDSDEEWRKIRNTTLFLFSSAFFFPNKVKPSDWEHDKLGVRLLSTRNYYIHQKNRKYFCYSKLFFYFCVNKAVKQDC